MIKDIIQKNRSYRRFCVDNPIERQTLLELVDLVRWVASARNLQPLRYIISWEARKNDLVFPCLTWPVFGGWVQPAPDERPTGYIILLGDTLIPTAIGIDTGIAAQSILMAAVERGLGGCILGSIEQEPLRSALYIPERYRILVVIALGKPAETVTIEENAPDPTAFWRNSDGIPYVCKRKLEDVLLDC
jgi:nitroreductase